MQRPLPNSCLKSGPVLAGPTEPVLLALPCHRATEQNYAQIEKEMLAIVFGCTHFHDYIYEMKDVQVETDHKPLQSILKKPLHQAPMRLQRIILKIQKYPLVVRYRPGKELLIADTLSRAYLPNENPSILDEELEVNYAPNIRKPAGIDRIQNTTRFFSTATKASRLNWLARKET